MARGPRPGRPGGDRAVAAKQNPRRGTTDRGRHVYEERRAVLRSVALSKTMLLEGSALRANCSSEGLCDRVCRGHDRVRPRLWTLLASAGAALAVSLNAIGAAHLGDDARCRRGDCESDTSALAAYIPAYPSATSARRRPCPVAGAARSMDRDCGGHNCAKPRSPSVFSLADSAAAVVSFQQSK
jgi:hypothetical protein